MSVTVRLYRFEKLANSTANPETASVPYLAEMPCALKGACSVQAPTLTLRFDNTSTIPGHANYAYIIEFGRYYQIMDWVCESNTVWDARLEVDVCGTFRNNILRSTQFVERAERSSNGRIGDRLSVITSQVSKSRIAFNTPWERDFTMVLGAVGGGYTVYYKMDMGQLGSLVNWMFSDSYANSVMPEWVEAYPEIKSQLNPLQFINSLRMFPFDVPASGSQTVFIGWGRAPISAPTFEPGYQARVTFFLDNITLPTHPQASSIPYTTMPPYTELGVWYPPFGDIPIDPGLVNEGGTLLPEITVDLISGKSILKLWGTSLAGSAEAMVGVDVALSQTYRTGFGIANTVADIGSFAASVAAGDYGGALAGFGETVQNLAASKVPKLRTMGGDGGGAASEPIGYAYGRFQHVIAPPAHYVGRPLFQTVELSTLLGGFVLCRNAEVESLGTVEETLKLERIMEEGFYLE